LDILSADLTCMFYLFKRHSHKLSSPGFHMAYIYLESLTTVITATNYPIILANFLSKHWNPSECATCALAHHHQEQHQKYYTNKQFAQGTWDLKTW